MELRNETVTETITVEKKVKTLVLTEQEARDIMHFIGKTSIASRIKMGCTEDIASRISDVYCKVYDAFEKEGSPLD